MSRLFLQILLSFSLLIFMHCDGDKSTANTTNESTTTVDLGDKDTKTTSAKKERSQVANREAWDKAVKTAGEGGIAANYPSVQDMLESRYPYHTLPAPFLLEDLIAYNQYFLHRNYEIVEEYQGTVLYPWHDDGQSDQKLAYPVVRESYLTNTESLYPNPRYKTLNTNYLLDESYQQAIDDNREKLSALKLVMAEPNDMLLPFKQRKIFFCDDQGGNLVSLEDLWQDTIEMNINSIVLEVYDSMKRDNGEPFPENILDMSSVDKDAFYEALENRSLSVEEYNFINRIADDLHQRRRALELTLTTAEKGQGNAEKALNQTENDFCKAVIENARKLLKDLEESSTNFSGLVNVSIEKTSASDMTAALSFLEKAIEKSRVYEKNRQELFEQLDTITKGYYEEVRNLEETYNRLHARFQNN